MIELASGDVVVQVSPNDGGRVASIVVAGVELLVTDDHPDDHHDDHPDDHPDDHHDDPKLWGSYPMVPWAGRVRGATFEWRGRRIDLAANMGRHAIHGTAFVSAWDVLDDGPDFCEMQCALTWPLGGTAHQHVQLTPDALVCVLTAVAGHDAMPVTLGWHPWFRKPAHDDLYFGAMYEQDDEGIPTGVLVEPRPRPWDDCFVRPLSPLRLHLAEGLTVTVSSDCDHWVAYDQPAHATCVEPQSGPPDAFNLGNAVVLEPGEMLQRTMTIAWS